MIKLIMVTFIFVFSIVFLSLSYAYAEDWTQIGYGGIQGFITESENNSAVGIMGFMNLELKHSHPESWFNYYNRMGVLGALEYYPNNDFFSATIQFPIYSYWISNESLLQISIGYLWAETIVVEEQTIRHLDEYGYVDDTETIKRSRNESFNGASIMLSLNYTHPKKFLINSGLLFLRLDHVRNSETRGIIGLSFGHSLLERFSN